MLQPTKIRFCLVKHSCRKTKQNKTAHLKIIKTEQIYMGSGGKKHNQTKSNKSQITYHLMSSMDFFSMKNYSNTGRELVSTTGNKGIKI